MKNLGDDVGAHPCAWSEADLLDACREERWRARGPGGQHANTTATGLRLTWLADPAIMAQADEARERLVNRRRALRRLRMQLALRVRGGSDRRWLDRHRRGPGFRVSARAADLPQILCVLLDACAAAQGSSAAAGAACGISGSALVRTLALDKQAWQALAAIRAAHDLSPLKHP